MHDRTTTERLLAAAGGDAQWASEHFYYGALLAGEDLSGRLSSALHAAGADGRALRVHGDPLECLQALCAGGDGQPPGSAQARLLLGVPRDRYFHDSLAGWRQDLGDGDVALVLGLFARRAPHRVVEDRPLATDFVRAAERAGFVPVLDEDLTIAAAGWVEALAAQAGPGAAACCELHATLLAGTHECRLVGLRAVRAPVFRGQALEDAHYDRVAALFSRVFKSEFPRARWEWKYGAGRGHGVLAWSDGELAGFYGGVTRDIRYFGVPDRAVQICDVMVDSGMRGVLTRRGAMFVCASTFLEQYIGYGAKHLLGFGFPTERHMLLAERQDLYDEVGRMVELAWPASTRAPRFSRLEPIGPEDGQVIDALWGRMASGMRSLIVGVRDHAYVARRYLDHPERTYALHLVRARIGGRPRAVLVTRMDEGRCEILDVIGEPSAMPDAIAWARRLAADAGAGEAWMWVSQAQQARLRGAEGTVRALDVRNPTSVWSWGPPAGEILHKWWLTGGDTDFR